MATPSTKQDYAFDIGLPSGPGNDPEQNIRDLFTALHALATQVSDGLESITVQTLLDGITNVQGSILYRDATGWVALAPGTIGDQLTTQGPAADPTWSAP